jgi:hypothetical protein
LDNSFDHILNQIKQKIIYHLSSVQRFMIMWLIYHSKYNKNKIILSEKLLVVADDEIDNDKK